MRFYWWEDAVEAARVSARLQGRRYRVYRRDGLWVAAPAFARLRAVR